ncbi:hypothetical protein CERSUDRAFT_76563 [Gelatoporia subvermispora B]|uniref:Uncharacterized protein n=1 Tax=Ceriporiopsis subvermispora (strain B) TaxID=914234 RepID=M2QMB5_CERS8|nr:hypothetical protein CERSUDRAFT_76563 [Gelatoporia subvermispora B]
MSNSSYPTNPSAVTSMAPAGTQYVPIPPFRRDSYYVAHSVDDILRYPPPSISTYSRRHAMSLYERPIQTDSTYSFSTEQYVGDAAQYLPGTEQIESIDALPAGSLQTEYTVQAEVQTGPINGVQQALDFRHSSWPVDDELQSNMTPYNAAENNIPVYNAAACAAPMYNTSGYEQGTDQFLPDGGMVPHNTPMPYVTTACQVPINTIAMPGIPYDMHSRQPSNHDNVAPHNIALHSTAEHYAPEYSVTTYPAPMGNAPVYTADQFAADSSELPYNTSVSYNATMHQLPMHTLRTPNAVGGTQDIGQYLPNHDLFPESPHASGDIASAYNAPPDATWVYNIPHAMQDVGQVAPDNGGQMPSTYEPVYDAPAYTGSTYQMSMDIGQTYQGPMGTMAMPNAPGGAHGMDQPDPESLTHSLQTGQRAPSTSSLQELCVTVNVES